MNLFHQIQETEHEQIVYCHDKASGLKAIIAIHDTTLGPALGGTRLLPYETEEEALVDVLRLSRGMTYKAACAGLHLGGGKAVIIADPQDKSELFWRTYGRFVQSLNGRYITAEDMNATVDDMDLVHLETNCVVGVSKSAGGSGDPGIMTALGTYHGIRASVQHRLHKKHLSGIKVAIQGFGSVGSHLAKLLIKDGVHLFVQDVDEQKLKIAKEKYNATIISSEEIYTQEFDVYCPCARGATVNSEHISQLKVPIIAGSANNQLEDENIHAKMLQERNILYAPDFVINAGGLINVANELTGYHAEKAHKEVVNIASTLSQIFKDADQKGVTTHLAALDFAQKRIESMKNLKKLHRHHDSLHSQARGSH